MKEISDETKEDLKEKIKSIKSAKANSNESLFWSEYMNYCGKIFELTLDDYHFPTLKNSYEEFREVAN